MVFHILKTAFRKPKIEFLFFRTAFLHILPSSDVNGRRFNKHIAFGHFFWYRQVFKILKRDGKAKHLASADTCCRLFVWRAL